MSKKILVTGGAGYIGSFIVRALKDSGFEPFIADNLSSGHTAAVDGFPLEKIDLVTEKEKLRDLFKKEKFDGVIHMASFIQMGESFKNPGKYFENNINAANNLFDVMAEFGVKKIVFSSSAGVYGTPKSLSIKEDDPKSPENPYGETKLMIERMLYWFEKAYGIKSAVIRYFNAAGAAPDGSIGEDHPEESHLIPIIIEKALKGEKFTIFGDDYDTKDGTAVRDYIHVLDLAEAHILSLKKLFEENQSLYFNAGVGNGYSCLEIVEKIKEITGLKLNYEIGPRRAGDPAALYADNTKIKNILGWKPKYGLTEIIESAYTWHKNHPEGYKK